ncbi:hypothetical protein LAZ67_15000848 [Cordylochernes scorpioides]|uniref:RNase H type-1 domain-containing protein n=1 Tax=Cordylochernes scorpioides TaxID=51811 RepID=A0ABY6L953_9ARAC|nr:hypothetical protein LAZ67_15000848 [Cordylochernes scorpioides]
MEELCTDCKEEQTLPESSSQDPEEGMVSEEPTELECSPCSLYFKDEAAFNKHYLDRQDDELHSWVAQNILNWESNIRLKKEGPLHLAKRNGFLKYKVEKNYLAEKISPCKPLQNFIFNATLNEPTNKQYQNPEYLKQLSLEIINNIPKNAITIFTNGSRDELGHTGSGCLIKTTNGIEKMNRRNPYFCSVFRSELIGIYEALKSIRNTNYQDIWILTDSRSNEAADALAKKGTKEPLPQKKKITFKEIETVAKTKINKNWGIPPKHPWSSNGYPGIVGTSL